MPWENPFSQRGIFSGTPCSTQQLKTWYLLRAFFFFCFPDCMPFVTSLDRIALSPRRVGRAAFFQVHLAVHMFWNAMQFLPWWLLPDVGERECFLLLPLLVPHVCLVAACGPRVPFACCLLPSCHFTHCPILGGQGLFPSPVPLGKPLPRTLQSSCTLVASC